MHYEFDVRFECLSGQTPVYPPNLASTLRWAFDAAAIFERIVDEIMDVTMKSTVLLIALVTFSGAALADKYVNGYTRKDGTYVQGHMKSSPDAYRYNNRGSQSYGGRQRDEYSSGTGATNKSNSSYGWRDNDSDGVSNPYDRKPDSKRGW
jgi:hypothetical protein